MNATDKTIAVNPTIIAVTVGVCCLIGAWLLPQAQARHALLAVAGLALCGLIVWRQLRAQGLARDHALGAASAAFALYQISFLCLPAEAGNTLLRPLCLLATGFFAALFCVLEIYAHERRQHLHGLTLDMLSLPLGIGIFAALTWHEPFLRLLHAAHWQSLLQWMFLLMALSAALGCGLMSLTASSRHSRYPQLFLLALLFSCAYLSTYTQTPEPTRLAQKFAASAALLAFVMLALYLPRPKHLHRAQRRHWEDGLLLISISVLILTVPSAIIAKLWQSAAPPKAEWLLAGTLLCVLSLCLRMTGLLRESLSLRADKRHQALHDRLTGLLNRNGLAALCARAPARKGKALLCIDIDDFKSINHHYGHSVGDALLKQVAETLRGLYQYSSFGDALRQQHMARVGGNEFALLVTDPDVPLPCLAQWLAQHLSRWWTLPHTTLYASVKVGLCDWCDGDFERLAQRAAAALYQAKRPCAPLADEAQREHPLSNRQHIRELMRYALQERQLSVCLQPIYCCHSESLCALETLARIPRPSGSCLMPNAFLPIVDADGLHLALTYGVIHALSALPDSYRQLLISINLPVSILRKPENIGLLHAWIQSAGFSADGIGFEILESQQLDEQSIPQLHTLKRLGYRLAVDDFGAGYANLSRLGQMPVDILKIDRSIVLAAAQGDHSALRSVLQLAQEKHYKVVAEGIETQHQFRQLRELGVDKMQGFYIARPTPLRELPESPQAMQQHHLFASALSVVPTCPSAIGGAVPPMPVEIQEAL